MLRPTVFAAILACLLLGVSWSAAAQVAGFEYEGWQAELAATAPELFAPGTYALRIRGAALSQLVEFPGELVLEAGGRPVASALVLPGAPGRDIGELAIIARETLEDGSRRLLIDRGEQAPVLNLLRLNTTPGEFSAAVHIGSGATGDEIAPTGGPQLVFRRVSGGVLKQLLLELPAYAGRYLELRIVGAGEVEVTAVHGSFDPLRELSLYHVTATIGEPRHRVDGDGQYWPLTVAEAGYPLAKLKILATADAGLARLRLVELTAGGQSGAELGAVVWADGVSAGGLTLDHKWLNVDVLRYGNTRLALVPDDGAAEELEISRVEAYAVEGWLYFSTDESLPASTSLRLVTAEEPGPLLTLTPTLEATAEVVGTLAESPVATPVPQKRSQQAEAWPQLPRLNVGRRWTLFGLLGGALVLLVLGAMLLGRQRQADG
jgi:hypothetical protein